MPRLPNLLRTPLRRGADAASLVSHALDQAAGALRRVAGEGGRDIPVEHRGTPRSVPTTPKPAAAPAAKAAPTRGRTAGERREPTPEPATGASAATRGTRQISNPKAARKNRARAARAGGLSTVEASGGTGHGGTPETVTAENTPKARAKAKAGREPAPMGSHEPNQ
jgi:hypothetical protein